MSADRPRIHPLAEGDLPDEVRPALGRPVAGRDRVPNVFTTFARHPAMFRRWLGLGDHLLFRSTLPAREREMIILRVAVLCGCRYEWAQHAVIARSAGLADGEIDRVRSGPAAPGWTDDERAVLEAVGELHAGQDVGAETWRRLAARRDTEQLMDLVMTVGFYTMTAMALNAFGVEVDPGLDGGPDEAREAGGAP